MKKAKSFKFWNSEEVEQTFGITRTYNNPLLDEWLNNNYVIDPQMISYLESVRDELVKKIEYWNEEELKYHFLGKFVNMVNFDKFDHYRSFLGRTLSAEVDGMTISGEVDFMVATGKQTPQVPFFFLHEYKQELKRDNDPLGQVLIAMVAAQARNAHGKPIYGCYVTGRFWYFVVLHEKEYSVSDAFKATDDEIYKITSMLLFAKADIEKTLKEMNK
jgi:hypothetical protein